MNTARERLPVALLLALCAAEITTSVEISMIHMAMPKIVGQYGDPGLAFWVITIYYLAAASSVTLSARLGDIFGRKRVLLWVLGISLCGSLISGLSSSYAGLLLGRALTGSVAAALPLCFGLVREHFPPSRVPMGIGISAAVPSVIGAASMLLGGALVDHLPWRVIFFASSLVAFVAVLAIWRIVPPHRNRVTDTTVDWLGGLLMIPAIVGLLGTINLAKVWGWTHPLPLAILAGSLLLLVFWIMYELRQSNPMVDLRLMLGRKIALTNLAMAAVAVSVILAASVISLHLQQPVSPSAGFGVSATMTAVLFLPLSLVSIVAGVLSGRIAERRGARIAALTGAGISTLGWVLLALEHSDLYGFAALFYLGVFGFSVLYSAIPNLIVEDAPKERTSEVTGVTTVIRLLSSAVGTQLTALALSWSSGAAPVSEGARMIPAASFSLVFWMYALTTALAAAMIWATPVRKESDAGTDQGMGNEPLETRKAT